MSVLLSMRMDVVCKDDEFDEVSNKAFPKEGVYRMLELPTLQWKIWGANPERKQVSGTYLFASREAAEAYAKQAVLTLQQRPAIANVTTRIWTIMEEQTRITKGPIDLPVIKQ